MPVPVSGRACRPALVLASALLTTTACIAGTPGDDAVPSTTPGPVTLSVTPSPAASETLAPGAAAAMGRVRRAVGAADSVAVRGKLVHPVQLELDLRLHADGGSGMVVSSGIPMEVRRLDGIVWVRSDDERAYVGLAGAADAPRLRGRWVRTTAADPRLEGLGELVHLDTAKSWVSRFLPTSVEPVGGDPGSLALLNAATSARLVVPAAPPFLPLRLERADTALRGEISYSAWDEPVRVVVPEGAEPVPSRSAQR